MKYNNIDLPEWFIEKLRHYDLDSTDKDIITFLLNDYIKKNKPKHIDLTDFEYVQRYASKKHEDGSIFFYNHDIDKWEESTSGRLDALNELRLNFRKYL